MTQRLRGLVSFFFFFSFLLGSCWSEGVGAVVSGRMEGCGLILVRERSGYQCKSAVWPGTLTRYPR